MESEQKTTEQTEGEKESVQYITYDEFSKLEIRIGTIQTVTVVPDADKLLQLTVSFGDEVRQIVSGIREFFADPESLVGRQCPFVTNLEPRTIRGLESQGMILAAGDDATFAVLHPDREIPAGTAVH